MNEEPNINQLPKDWKWEKLGEVCVFSQGIQVDIHKQSLEKINGQVRFLRIIDFTQEDEPARYIEFPGDRYFLRKDDIAMVRYGTVGFVCTGKEGVIANNLFKIIPNQSLDKKYLIFFLNSHLFKGKLKTKGATMQALSFGMINPILVPIPPLPIQQAIVSKIEELFSELDKGIENLRLAQQQLKIYRQSILKWAFEKLDKENTIEEITESSLIGLVRSGKDQNESAVGVPYIKMNNIDLNGNIDFNKLVYVAASKSEINKFQLKKGDILINTRNSFELVGKTGIVREEITNAVFNNNLLRIRVKNNLLPLFIGYQLINPSLKGQMLKEKKATTNICALYQRDIFPLRVKICSIEDQLKIVQEIERRLSVADKMQEIINQSLQQAEALRQSILKKAFEGRLQT